MTRQAMQEQIDAAVKAAFSERSRLAGLKGGPARAAALSPSKRKQIAKKASRARWDKAKSTNQ